MAETKYNGWSNYETWCVSLWLNNDEGIYRLMCEEAERIKNKPEFITIGEINYLRSPEIRLADFIKEFVEENNPLEKASMYMNLLNAAILTADFTEIAKGFLED